MHTLQHVLSFLDILEYHQTASVSKNYNQAVKTMPQEYYRLARNKIQLDDGTPGAISKTLDLNWRDPNADYRNGCKEAGLLRCGAKGCRHLTCTETRSVHPINVYENKNLAGFAAEFLGFRALCNPCSGILISAIRTDDVHHAIFNEIAAAEIRSMFIASMGFSSVSIFVREELDAFLRVRQGAKADVSPGVKS